MSEKRPWASGPWFVAPATRADGLAVIEDGRDHGLFPITCEWSEANLVAAAPELFEALEAMQRAYFDYHDDRSMTEPVTGRASNANALAIAALAKAKGEA